MGMSCDAIEAVDYHAAGQVFRIVTAGVPAIPGATVLSRRAAAEREEFDRYRRLICLEPRGHGNMCGCYLVPPDDTDAHLGALLFHPDGYPTVCGDGTMALGAWAVQTGLVPPGPDGITDVVIDLPSGRVVARVRGWPGRIESVTFRNVPTYVLARGIVVDIATGPVVLDTVYSGAVYASLPAASLGLPLEPATLPAIVDAAQQIKNRLNQSARTGMPEVYGVILHEELPSPGPDLRQRNVTVYAAGRVDRSPCGSGTCARTALLHADGRLPPGARLHHESLIGTSVTATIADTATIDGRERLTIEVTGTAHKTDEHRFNHEPTDWLESGFLVT
jgi:proline racemase